MEQYIMTEMMGDLTTACFSADVGTKCEYNENEFANRVHKKIDQNCVK